MQDRRTLLKGFAAAGALAVAGPLAAVQTAGAGEAIGRSGRVGGKPVKVVDIHAHCVLDMREVIEGTPFQARSRAGAPGQSIDAARLAAMARKGIDAQVLSINPYWYDMDRDLAAKFIDVQNSKLSEVVQANPGRYYGLATVSLQHPDLAVRQLEDGMKRKGLRGASLGCTVNEEELASPRFDPFWKKCLDLNATAFLHPQNPQVVTGIARRTKGAGSLDNVIGNPLETTIALSHLIFQGTFDRFPGLRICAAHGGGYLGSYPDRSDYGCRANPQTCKPTDPVLKKKPSEYLRDIYVDSLVFSPEATRHLAAVCGPRQIMLGTDYPYAWFENPVQVVMATPGLSDADKAAILGGTACRLFDIPI